MEPCRIPTSADIIMIYAMIPELWLRKFTGFAVACRYRACACCSTYALAPVVGPCFVVRGEMGTSQGQEASGLHLHTFYIITSVQTASTREARVQWSPRARGGCDLRRAQIRASGPANVPAPCTLLAWLDLAALHCSVHSLSAPRSDKASPVVCDSRKVVLQLSH